VTSQPNVLEPRRKPDILSFPVRSAAERRSPSTPVNPATAAAAGGATIPMPNNILSAVALDKSYWKGHHKVPVLRGVEITVRRGEFLSIVGQSGSGKSTLMHLLGLLDAPDIGEIFFDGRRIDDLPVKVRDELRNRAFGFIFQFYHLLPELNLLENVLAPLMIRQSLLGYFRQRKEYEERAKEIIAKVRLDHRMKHRPSELSGGEMQRAAIARALVARPQVLLADEPTGNLDTSTGGEIMDLLTSLNGQDGLTIVMVTHDPAVAQRAHRTVRLDQGRIETVTEAATRVG
jgi:lipoprotein-releasing system ATP-binding protein